MVKFITRQLLRAGAAAAAVKTDQAHRRSPFGGEVGNLVFKLRGTRRAPRRMLMAHVDTVPICGGAKVVLDGGMVRSTDPKIGVGADNRAGAAVLLVAAIEILRRKLPHPPLTFFFPVQEELGLHGAHHANLNLLGGPKLAFNFDGGTVNKLTIGAIGGYRVVITVEGKASHAGGAPEQGVSAIAVASLAIADLVGDGWHGAIKKGRRTGTANIGTIEGGTATNVVADRVDIKAETRSHDPVFRRRIVAAIEKAFEKAAQSVRSNTGQRGKVTCSEWLDYESFRLADDEPCVLEADRAVRSIGLKPIRAISNGGVDANWMTTYGIPTVTLGCGHVLPHTTGERLNVEAFSQACKIGLRLATAEM